MSNFKTLFGIESTAIQKTCVIVPYLVPSLLKALGIEELKKGKLHATAHTDTFTFIFEPLEPKDKLQIDSAIQTACKATRSFCKNQLTTEDTENLELNTIV